MYTKFPYFPVDSVDMKFHSKNKKRNFKKLGKFATKICITQKPYSLDFTGLFLPTKRAAKILMRVCLSPGHSKYKCGRGSQLRNGLTTNADICLLLFHYPSFMPSPFPPLTIQYAEVQTGQHPNSACFLGPPFQLSALARKIRLLTGPLTAAKSHCKCPCIPYSVYHRGPHAAVVTFLTFFLYTCQRVAIPQIKSANYKKSYFLFRRKYDLRI
jgi:hypothetical protein